MDRTKKFKLYAQFKVPRCWIVDPMEKTMEMYELVKKSTTLLTFSFTWIQSSFTLPGLKQEPQVS